MNSDRSANADVMRVGIPCLCADVHCRVRAYVGMWDAARAHAARDPALGARARLFSGWAPVYDTAQTVMPAVYKTLFRIPNLERVDPR